MRPDRTPEEGYHLTEDLADESAPLARPAAGAGAGQTVLSLLRAGRDARPHPRPGAWRDRYRGEFDQGWDALREETFAVRSSSASSHRNCELTAPPGGHSRLERHPGRDETGAARQMELYAAFLEHTDHCIGQVVDAIEELGALDDTLIYVITGDNGASGEGTLNGTWNESLTMTGMTDIETPEFLREHLDSFGTPGTRTRSTRSAGRHAMDTPYQWTKRVASHWGGTRNGLIVHWPAASARGRAAPPVPPRHRRRADLARGRRTCRSRCRSRRRPAADRGRQHGVQLR